MIEWVLRNDSTCIPTSYKPNSVKDVKCGKLQLYMTSVHALRFIEFKRMNREYMPLSLSFVFF